MRKDWFTQKSGLRKAPEGTGIIEAKAEMSWEEYL